jgi:hypothetical protein
MILTKIDTENRRVYIESPDTDLVSIEAGLSSNNYKQCCYWKHLAFTKHRENLTTFIETGTAIGEGILSALCANFKDIITIEAYEPSYNIAYDRWKHRSDVKIYFGSSEDHLENILNLIDYKCFFWLDAHFHDSSPTYSELEMIKAHPIKNHTILIDDISLYFDKNHIEKTLLDINPNYVISYEPTWRNDQEILIAKTI